jgi:hypothetical protein
VTLPYFDDVIAQLVVKTNPVQHLRILVEPSRMVVPLSLGLLVF